MYAKFLAFNLFKLTSIIAELRLTDLNLACIPPPMCHVAASLNDADEQEFVVSMALSAGGRLAVLSTRAHIKLCKLNFEEKILSTIKNTFRSI